MGVERGPAERRLELGGKPGRLDQDEDQEEEEEDESGEGLREAPQQRGGDAEHPLRLHELGEGDRIHLHPAAGEAAQHVGLDLLEPHHVARERVADLGCGTGHDHPQEDQDGRVQEQDEQHSQARGKPQTAKGLERGQTHCRHEERQRERHHPRSRGLQPRGDDHERRGDEHRLQRPRHLQAVSYQLPHASPFQCTVSGRGRYGPGPSRRHCPRTAVGSIPVRAREARGSGSGREGP